MTHRTKRVFKILVLALLAALVTAVLAGCTERPKDSVVVNPPNTTSYQPINYDFAKEAVRTASANRKEQNALVGDEEWFVFDITLDFSYTDRTDGVEQTTKFSLIFKANWNTIDNNKSELYLRVIDTESLTTVIGVYYYEKNMYVTLMDGIAGYENMNYRFREVNFSTLASLLSPLLSNMGLDPLSLVMSIATGNSKPEILAILESLGVSAEGLVNTILGAIDGLIGKAIFDGGDGQSTYELSADGNTETVGFRLKLNDALNLLTNAGPILGIIIPGVNTVSWEAFGLPDFDPIMEQFLGFSLAKLREKDWPQMSESFLKGINVKKTVDGVEKFVLEGMEIDIACDATDEYPLGQYGAEIRLSPFFFGAKREKIDISFSGLDLSENSTKYREGGLLNLEAQLALEFTAPENTTLTVGEILGDTLDDFLPENDLTSLKNLPISFNGFNFENPDTGERMTRYRFDLEIKTDLDLFHGENNAAEINLYSQDEKILSVYLVGTTLYIYTEELKGGSFSIPNLSIPNLDLTDLLFGEEGALGVIMPYLDPDYAASEAGGEAAGNAAGNASAAEIDVMSLLKELITYKSYYNWKGEKIENATGNITLPGDEDAPLVFEFDQDTLNYFLMNFLDSADLGIESLRLETMLSHPQDSTKLTIELPKNVKAQILMTKLAWLGRPDFDFSNVENKEYSEVGGDAQFYAQLGGEFKIGIDKTDDAAKVVLNLSDLIGTLTTNLFLDLGLNVSDTAETTIRYEIKADFDMKMKNLSENVSYMSFRDTKFALYLYAGNSEKSFLMLYYDGKDDMLYIDLTKLSVLQETIPLFNIFKPIQPSIKIKLGLDTLLENQPKTAGIGVTVNENLTNTDFLMNYLTGAGVSFGNANGAALDPVDLVGKLLEGLYVQNDTLSIIASKQMLSVLLSVLNVSLGEGTVLPGTNIFGNLSIMNPDPEKGFLELHLGLVGEGGAGNEFLSLDLYLLNKIDVSGNPESFEIVDPSFNPETYTNLANLMESLQVAFEMEGRLQLEPMREGGFSLGELLAKLIGAKYVDPYINTIQISSDLSFKLKANIDISGMTIPEGGEFQFDPTTLLNSELSLEIVDRKDDQTILGIYYKGQDLYLDLHYFLKENGYIRLKNAGNFIYQLIKGASMQSAPRSYTSESGAVSIKTNANTALDAIRLNVLATITPYGLTVAIAEGALTNLLGGLLGIDSDVMIKFGQVDIGLDISNGIDLTFSTSIEDALRVSLDLGGLSLSVNPNDKIKILVPQGVTWIESDMSTLLSSVLVRVELSLGVGGKGQIDLSPLISSLLTNSGDPTASKIDVDVIIENLGLDGAELNAVVEADLNFQEIAKSELRLSLYKGAIENGEVILTAIYNGAENKMYLKTQLFGISNNNYEFKELDIDKLIGSFMQNALKDANEGAEAVEVRNNPLFSLFSGNGSTDPMREFVQIIFVKGGIQLKVAEEALIFLFRALGIDASAFFDEFDLDAEGELSINPISLTLNAKLNGDAFTFHLGLTNLAVSFGGEIDKADLNEAIAAGNVTKIDSFTSVGVNLAGTLGVNVSSGTQDGNIYFDKLIENILGAVQLPAGVIDEQTLSTLGLLIKVIEENTAGYPNFGGTIYYEIGGVLNIAKIENLFLTLKLGSTKGANDVLDVVVRGSAEAGSTGVDIYVNAEKLLGVKPFVIKNVAKFIEIFTGTGLNARGSNLNGNEMPRFDRSGDVKNLFAGLTLQNAGTDGALANAIVLYLAANYEEAGLKAPIVLDVGAGALYGLLASLAGIDLGAYLEGHDVFAELTAAGADALLTLDLGLQGLMTLHMDLETPTLDLQPKVPDAPLGGYTVLDETFTTLRVKLDGKASFKGDFDETADPNDPNNKNVIDLANLLGSFLPGVDLGILINLLGDIDKTMKFSIDVTVNLKKLIAGDWSGLNGKVEFFDTGDKLLIGAYYFDGNLYLDSEALNLGKIRIDNFAVFLQKIIGTSPSAAGAEARNALPQNASERDAALNAAAAAAYVNILLGNDTGIVLEVTAEAIALILSAISVGDTALDGNLIAETFHNVIELKLGLFAYDPDSDTVHILGLGVKVASYAAELAFDSAKIDFENLDVRPDKFTEWQQGFGTVGELSEWIYVNAALDFGWHLSDGMEVDFTDILGTFLAEQLDMLSISPVLKILNEFGQNFKLEVEGKIHFGNLMRDGTLLPELIGSNGFNPDPLMDSELTLKLIATGGDAEREVISLAYVDRTLYLDLSAFSIGKVRIPDAYNFFVGMFAPGNNPAALSYALPYSSDPAANAGNDASYIAKQLSVVGSFINLNISPSAVALQVGTAGLFALLNLVGLDLGGIGLTMDDLYNLVNPLGNLDLSVWLLKQDQLLQLAIALKQWNIEGVEESGKEIALTLGLSSDFKITVGDDKIPQHVVIIPNPDEYDRLTDDAMISVATRLDFNIDLETGTVDNVFKDPLESLIGSLLTQIALSIGVEILDDQSGTVTLSIEAELPILTLVAGITAGGFDLSAITARIELLYSKTGERKDEQNYATLVLHNGDLFADLTKLGGPKAMIKDLMGLMPSAAAAPRSAAAYADGNAPGNAEGGEEQLLPKLPVSLELLYNGFFITIKKSAFNTIFGLINVNGKNLGDWEITDDVKVVLGLTGTDNPIYGADGQSFKLGASLAFTEGTTDVLTLGIDLNGIGAQFKRFGISRPDASEYANIMDVDYILAKTSLEFNLRVNDNGEVNLQKTVEALFNALGVDNPLGIPLAPKIQTMAALEDTLRLDLEIAVNIGAFSSSDVADILAGINVKASLYSIGRPDFFKIDIAFDNATAYIDASVVGLGKIVLPVRSLMDRILNGTSGGAEALAAAITGNGAAMAAPMDSKEAEARKMLAATHLMIGKSGVVAIVAYDTIETILQMIGVPIGDYIDGVISPSVEIEITDRFGFNIVAHILNGTADSEVASLGLSLVGQSTNVDVKVSSVQEIVSFKPADAESYTSYDKLMLTLDVNASISVDFFGGYIPLDEVLDLLISNMKMGIDVGETHSVEFRLNGKVGIDLEAFLAKKATSFFGELSLDYIIKTADSVYDQTIAKVYIVEEGIFVELKLQDIGLDLKVKIPDLNIPDLIWNLIDGKDPFAAAGNDLSQVVSGETRNVPFNAPLTTLLNAKAAGRETDYALPILIGLNSQELSVEISTLLLATILPLLGLQIESPETLVESILTEGKLAISVDPTFRIYFQLRKEAGGDPYIDKDGKAHERGGYQFELSLFDETVISTDRERYLEFARRFTSAYESAGYGMVTDEAFGNELFSDFAETFLAFNLKKLITGGEFDVVEDFISTLGGKIDIELGVDFKQLVFDLSALFANEDDAYFYIQIAEALKSAVKISVEFDASLKGIIKDATLGVDAILNFENEYGDVLLSVMLRGGGSGVSSAYEDGVYPAIYLYSEAMGIPKLKVNSPVLEKFANLDLNALLKSLGLKIGDDASATSYRAAGAPQNGILDNSDEGLVLGGINIANLLDSVSINPGKLSIVLAKSIVKDILAALLNFPFDDVEDISATIADGLYLNIELQKGFALKMNLSTLEVNLGGRAVFGETKSEVQKTFEGYLPLSEYKWSFELESELTITDELISVFSLARLTTPLIGADVTIEAGEVLGTKLTFYLKGYIDFADLSNISLQLAIVSGGKQYVNIMYVGDSANPKNSWVYLDLTGLGLTSLKLNLDVGSIVKNLLGSLSGGEETPAAAGDLMNAIAGGAADAAGVRNESETPGSGSLLKSDEIQWGLADGGTLKDVPFGAQLLLLAIGSKDVSVAITGALLTSLIHGLTDAVTLPEINYIRIGYVEGVMTGLELVLNEENFRIAYSFTDGSTSEMGREVKNPIDPTRSATGEKLTYSMSDIGVIQQVFVGLNMEIRINTRNTDEKSSQIEALEGFIESLLKLPDGTIDFAPQDTSMILSFNLQLALNLADLNKTQLALTISFDDIDLLAVYFDKGNVYADLSGLGLFEAKISGLDIISLILNLLGDTLDLEGGLKVGDLIDGVLPASPANASANGAKASSNKTYANAAATAGGVTKQPKIRVVLTNDSLFIIPSMSSIGAIVEIVTGKPLGFDLPELAEIRLGINLKDGLNNLSLKLKLDNYNNGVDISIPADGGLTLKLNDPNQSVTLPSNFDTYGGVSGLSLSNGGISLNTTALISSILDSIDAPNTLGIYIKKRNSHFNSTTSGSFQGDTVTVGKNPPSSPLTDNGYYNGYYQSRQTAASLTVRRDQATNYLELSVGGNSSKFVIRYNACALYVFIPTLNIKVAGINIGWIVSGIMNTFVKDGIQIPLNLLDTIAGLIGGGGSVIGEIGSLSGNVTDDAGAPVTDAIVTVDNGVDKKKIYTDNLGNYAFTGLKAGEYSVSFAKNGYFEVLRDSVDVKNMQNLDKAQRLDVQMFAIGSTTGTFTDVGFRGKVTVKGSDPKIPIEGAEVYIDNRKVQTTDSTGSYNQFYSAISGSRHTILIKAPNYDDFETTVELKENGKNIVTDFEMTPVKASKGVIRGTFVEEVEEDGKMVLKPVYSDVEIWLKKDGRTLIDSSSLTPYDYLGWKDGERLGTISSDGTFAITGLDYGTYYLKIRSTVYENIDLYDAGVTVKEGATVISEPIVLKRRVTTHFSENKVTDTMIAGIRIRLGADKLDKDGNTDQAGDVIGNAYETGGTDQYDNVTYIEAWLGENLVTGLFDMVHSLISSGLSSLTDILPIGTGYADVAADARVSPHTLMTADNTYNENDITVFDYRFAGRAAYLQYQTAFMSKLSSALLRNIVSGALKSYLGGVPNFVVSLLMPIVRSTFQSVTELINTIFPFTVPYSLAENKDLPGNPLEGFNRAGWLTEGTTDATADDPALTRKVNYAEKSVYARIKLNRNNSGGLLESIKLFVNGAEYSSVSNGAVNTGDFSLKNNYLDAAPVQTVAKGTVQDAKKGIDAWLNNNTVNDYIVIEDYATDVNGNQYLYNQYYIRNNETDATQDDYFELDIVNTGLGLKAVKSLGAFANLYSDGSFSETINLPERVIFNNPYDLSDFTVVGGSWAASAGGIRSNTDKNKTVTELNDILPNRNKVSFRAGGSDGSAGAGVYWNLSVVDFKPEGGDYYIIGSCLNMEIRVPCTVMPRTISDNDILSVLKGGSDKDPIPAIDPYNYDEKDYIDSLPKSFREGSQTVTRLDNTSNPELQTGKYVFDELRWDMSDVVISNAGSAEDRQYTIRLSYGFAGSGKGTVNVPVKVLNRTAETVSAAVRGSYLGAGITNGVVTFDPFEITAGEARKAVSDLVRTYARLTTVSGAVDARIERVDLGSFRTADFDNLVYTDGAAQYTIYLTFENSEGERTRVPVTIKVLDKRIESTSLGNLTDEERTIQPFRKGGMYDKNVGLNNLPSTVTVYYRDGSQKILTQGADYLWGLDLGGSVVLEGKKAGVDNWRGLMAYTGGTYRFRIFGTDGLDVYRDTVYGMDLIVEPAQIDSAETLSFNPYGEIALPGELAVGMNGSPADRSRLVNVRWLDLSDKDVAPNFAGSVQFSDVEVYDALFESIKIQGVKVVVKQANADALAFADTDGKPYEINPYLAAGQIEKLLADARTHLIVEGGVTVTKDLFEVIGYEITDATLYKVRILVEVGNRGYADGNRMWSQKFVMNLNVKDMSRAKVEPVTVDSVFDGLPTELKISLDGEQFTVPVTYLYDRIANANGGQKDFYRSAVNEVPFVPKNLPSVTETVTVTVTGASDVSRYELNGAWNGSESVYAFDAVPMPATATLHFESGAKAEHVPVVWDSVENYTAAGGIAVFRGRIGAEAYGYYDVEYRVEIEADEITMTDLPDLIQLDPLKDLAEQLEAYAKVGANGTGGAIVADVEFPTDEIDFNYTGTEEIVLPVKVGRKLSFTAGDVYVYTEMRVVVQVMRREAAKLQNEFVGNIYSEIDFNAIKEVSVVFESGEILSSNVKYEDWSGLDRIDYARANVYTVSLTVFADVPRLTQTVEVLVTVKSAVLTAAYRSYQNGRLSGKVNGLIGEQDETGADAFMTVDPFKGFDKALMPAQLWAQFDGFDLPILLSADWSYDHIVYAMSVLGGEFTVKDHNAGRVTLFLDKDGERVRPQQLQFEVKVTESIVSDVQFSTDANASENSDYENLEKDKGVSTLPTDRAVYYKKYINPYDLKSYNENPMASDFTYYRAIKVMLSGGQTLYFNLENTEYQIYDAHTKLPTVKSDLYKGRDVIVRMIANRDNLRVNGKQVLASDAVVTAEISVRIYDMTYSAGGNIPSVEKGYTVDLYKDYFNYGDMSEVLTIRALKDNIDDIATRETIFGTDLLEGSSDTFVSAAFDGIRVSDARLNPNYTGDTGYLDYTFGNEVGGMQTVSVPVKFVKRVLDRVFDPDTADHYYRTADGNPYVAGMNLWTKGAEDPTMKIDPAYTKNFIEGFLYDPFADYTAESFLMESSNAARFIDEDGNPVTVDKNLPITWNTGKLYIDLNGGEFNVSAVVSTDAGGKTIEQTVRYRYRVIKRKAVYATSADDPKGASLRELLSDRFKNNGAKIAAYDYIEEDDVDAAVGRDVFKSGNPEFSVEFTEGSSLEYNLGVNAGTVNLKDANLVPEGTINMSFRIDSLKPLNSKGNDVRFELTIPGYGLGAAGQQSVYLYVKSKKQEISSVKTWVNQNEANDAGSKSQPLFAFFTKGIGDQAEQYIQAIDESANATNVLDPYFFIDRGGLELPSNLWITVKDESGAESGYWVKSVNWTGARSNFYTVPYTGGVFAPSFQMPVDSQTYAFYLKAEAMLFQGTNGILFDTSSTPFAPGEVILLPLNSKLTGNSKTVVTDNGAQISDANYTAGAGYGYNIRFSNGRSFNFAGINGGGNARNKYNRWDLTSVDFGDFASVQYATLTLGGRGGETVKWALRISDSKLIGTTMQTVQTVEAGASAGSSVAFDFSKGAMGELGGNANGRLPDRYYQYFNGGRTSGAIPVTYGGLLSDGLGSFYDEEKKVNLTNFTYNATTRTVGIVEKNTATPAPIYTEKPDTDGNTQAEKGASKAAAIKWTATTYRAYPLPSEEVGGYLYFGMYPYMQTVSNKTTDAYFRNPENYVYSYNSLAPSASGNGWFYPNGLSSDTASGDRYLIPQFADDGSGTKIAVAQNEVPIYEVKAGTAFDVKYLPLFTIEGSVYYMPWNLATVYYADDNAKDNVWRYDANVIDVPGVTSGSMPSAGSLFSFTNGQYNATLSGGIAAIDTSKAGNRYTLVLNLPNAASNRANGNFQLIIAIDIVA